jgi:FixJ family two-component response regulator/glycine cleavage system H lipoate-binding protein
MSSEPKLLVVDDEAAICEGCSRIFSRQGFAVEKCSDAARGLDLAIQQDFNAILLDMKMPGMDGLHFLELLRKEKPSVPVVLMTGYPSIPNAASAIRLGVSDYVTKPFTAEEITQAVYRLLHLNKDETPSVYSPSSDMTNKFAGGNLQFYRDAWYQSLSDGPVRVGTVVVRPGTAKDDSIILPRIGEVVYQGLPLAAVKMAGQPDRIIPSPVSGVVIEVNDLLTSQPALLTDDPCGKGWVAGISPTRLDDESKLCRPRRVVLLSADPKSAKDYTDKLRWLGCDVRAISSTDELNDIYDTYDSHVLLFDAASFGGEGPAMVGEINTKDQSMKIVVLASTGVSEAAYRIRRIFYYAVDPFTDNEIADILAAAFQPATQALPHTNGATPQPLNGITITNHNGKRVRLLASPGLLRREDGLGQLLRQKMLQKRFPLESSPDEIQITPMNLLSLANRCDKLIVLLAQDFGRLPGSLAHDIKAEYVALVGQGADKVTTLLIQPSENADHPLTFQHGIIEALAEHLVNEMTSA